MTEQAKTDLVTRDQRRAELEQLTFSQNGQLFQPKTGRELMDMANMVSTAGFMVKDIYRNNPGACMGLVAICAPYGLNPLQVSWKTYKASKSDDSPIAFEAQVVVAMVNASGVVRGGLRYRYEGEGAARVCIASGILSGSDEPLDVRSPPIGLITVKNSPLWKSDPDQQLAYYTGRSWARRYKPEMLLGVYDVDELSGPPIRDITPKPPGGFAQKAVTARQTAEPVPVDEAETVQDDGAHWTDDEPTEFFPGSDAFTAGATAFKQGIPARECPFDEGTEAGIEWVAGWHGMRRAAE
ncbi:MAG: hypothetical protein ACRC14_07735 [Paracoccaceae bacterium]